MPHSAFLRRMPRARLLVTVSAAVLLLAGPARAQSTASPATPPPAAASSGAPAPVVAPADPVIAKVDGQPIYASDLREAIQTLPANARALPKETLYPLLLDQIIDARALLVEARRANFDKEPDVQRQMHNAADRALQGAWLHHEIDPLITDAALKARYDRDVAGKPGETEVHARHILVADEATAKKIIADLKKGGDFEALSKQYSTDPGASQVGGDLGFFRKDDMVPEFADAAFKLKDGEVASEPVHSQFGWHVIQTLGRRAAEPPPFDQAKDDLRQKVVQEAAQKLVAKAVATVKVEKFNMDGSTPRATDMAEPPPAK